MTSSDVQVKQSPYATHAWEFIEHGIPCLPVAPGTKVPGTCSFGEWRPMHGWQLYAGRLPTDVEVSIWNDWPGAGVCVPLGGLSGLLGIDIDTNRPDIIAALESELAGLLICRKRGKRGYTAFVRATSDVPLSQTKWNVDKLRVLDLLHLGRQVVMPPSIHPDTNAPYTWETPFRPWDDEVPVCPVDIVERCSRAIAKFQSPDDKRHEDEDRHRATHPITDSDQEGRQLNNAALNQLSRWVPDLIPAQYLTQTFNGYRAKPFWRGVTDKDKCSIFVEGIRDFGEEKGYTALDLVMAVRGGTIGDAMDWLAGRLGIARQVAKADWSDVGEWFKDFNYKLPEEIAREAMRQVLQEARAPAPVIVVDDGTTVLRPIAKPSLISIQGMPQELMQPPGIAKDIYQWMLETAPKHPLPEVAMQGVLAFGSLMASRIYEGPTGLRSNLTLIGVAPTSFGKDHPQKCVKKLMTHLNMQNFLGGSKIASGSAIISRLAMSDKAHTVCYVIDEVDSLLSSALGRNAQSHHREIADNLMVAYSASNDPAFTGTDRADTKTNRNDPIPFPHITFFGCTTPDKFYDCLKGKDVASGFLNRMVVTQAGEDKQPRNRKPPKGTYPNGIKLWADAVRNPRYAVQNALSLGATADNPVTVEYAEDGAEGVLDAMDAEAGELMDRLRKAGNLNYECAARWHENALRIAMICGVFKHPQRPVIDRECAQWACDYIRWSGRAVIDAVGTRTYESDFDEAHVKVLGYITKCGERGATRRDLVKGCRAYKGLDERGAKMVMDRMTGAGLIELRSLKGTRNQERLAWVALEDDGDE